MERYRFGVETMEGQEIRVMTVADLARVAETARRGAAGLRAELTASTRY